MADETPNAETTSTETPAANGTKPRKPRQTKPKIVVFPDGTWVPHGSNGTTLTLPEWLVTMRTDDNIDAWIQQGCPALRDAFNAPAEMADLSGPG